MQVQSGLSGVPSPQDLADKAKSALGGDLTSKIEAAAGKVGKNPAADLDSRVEKVGIYTSDRKIWC